MKKRIVFLFTLILLIVSMLAACGGRGDGGTPNPENCTHEYESKVTKDATCTAEGTLTYTCALCNDSYTEAISAKGHSYATSVTEPTCTDKGYTTYTCACGETYNDNYSSPLGHKATDDKYKAPTCTEDGWSAGATCSICNAVLEAQEKIPATGHDYTSKTTAPTCTEGGYTTYTCHCGDTYTADEKAALGHTEVIDEAKAPTCTETGLTEGKHCSVCNTVLVAQETVAKLDHNYSETLKYNETHHYYECDCGAKKEEAPHVSSNPESKDEEKCASCDYIIPSACLRFKTLNVYGTSATGTVSNSTMSFSFIDEIETFGGAKFTVSLDEYGVQSVATKVVPLVPGDNTIYIIETVDGEPTLVYTVTIRRLPMYIVSFNTHGGSSVDSQMIEEGSLATEPTKPTRTGYTFDGWDFDFSTPITNNTEILAKWTAGTGTAYTVKYYKENLTKTGYDLAETLNFTGTSGSAVTAEEKTYKGFTFNSDLSSASGNISGDGSLVLEVYYTRNVYSVSPNDSSIGSITNAGEYIYTEGSELTLTASILKLGYSFVGWYSDDLCLSTATCYKTEIDRDIVAKFDVTPQMQNFIFTSTDATCSITGIIDKTVTEIIVPDYVTNISFGAFSGCSNLESITIPFVGGSRKTSTDKYQYPFGYIFGSSSYDGGVKTEQYYYGSSTSTSSITYSYYYIPASLKTVTVTGGNILYSAFRNCKNLTSITLPNSVTSIGDKAFYECTSLTSVTIPNSVTSIGYEAFYECTSLTSIRIPDSVTFMGYDTFEGCSNIESITIPFIGSSPKTSTDKYQYPFGYIFGTSSYDGSVATQQYYYGSSTSSTTSSTYYIPASLKSVTVTGGNILYGAFYGCKNLTSVTIPDSVTNIGSYAFRNCTSLTSITIPDSVTGIGSSAFIYCYKLVEVINKSSLNIEAGSSDYGYIGKYAKEVHNGESKIVNKDNYLFYTYNGVNYLLGYVGNDTELTLPDSYNGEGYEIYDYAFSSCDSLTSVTIPNSVTSIGNSAFSSCTSLEEIYFNATAMNDLSSNNYVFYNAGKYGNGIKVVIGKNVTKIPAYLFYPYSSSSSYSPKITSVEFEDGSVCENIGNYAFYACTSVKNVTIGSSIASIGDYAFYSCANLASVTIPNSVTNIGNYAFHGCKALKNVTIGNSVAGIGNYAFYGCTNLASITIPDSVTSVGDYAFSGCTSLTSVTIGNSVTSIGDSAFKDCYKLVEVINKSNLNIEAGSSDYGYIGYYAKEVHNGESKIVNKDNYLFYTYDGVNYLLGYVGNDTELTLPDSYNGEGYEIYKYAFYKCTSLTSVTIPSSVLKIDSYAFGDCSKLKTVTFAANSQLSSIGEDAFFGCTSLTGVYITDIAKWCNISFGDSDANPLRYAKNLCLDNKLVTDLIIPDTVTTINSYAFYNCTSFTSITIPDSITTIDNCAFYGCTSLKTIRFNAIAMNDLLAKNYVFYDAGASMNVIIGKNVTKIPAYLFCPYDSTSYAPYITNVEFEKDSVCESIGSYAFSNCDSLESITIPSSVLKIDSYAFTYCSDLKTVTFAENSQISSIGSYAFSNCDSLESIIIPNSVTSIGERVFYSCDILKGVTIGNNVANISKDAFNSCASLESIIIPANVKEIEKNAFYSCKNLTSITIENGVIYIGENAFEYCTSLTSVTIPNSVTSIGSYAFRNCTNLTSVAIGNNVTTIGDYAFYCVRLEEIYFNSPAMNDFDSAHKAFYNAGNNGNGIKLVIGKNVTKIPAYLFCAYDYNSSYTPKITSVEFEDGSVCESIGKYAFYECTSLTNVTIGNSVTSIGECVFYSCDSLTSITIPDSVTSIGEAAFENCTSLTSVTIGNGATSIGGAAFRNCTSLTSVTIGNGATSIGDYAFAYCDSLTSFTIPDSVTDIGSWAFYSCDSLTSVTIGNGVTSIGDYAFDNCTSLTSVTIGNSVTSIGYSAFDDCTSLTSVTIPNSVTGIGKYAFYGCYSLTSVTIGNSVTSIGDSAFKDCYKLVEVINKSSLNIKAGSSSYGYIGYYAKEVHNGESKIVNKDNYLFYTYNGVNYLLGYVGNDTELTLPDSYNGEGYEIYKYAFEYCTSLTSVTIGNSVTSIDAFVFSYCSNLTSIKYRGTVAQWNAISKSSFWDYNTGNYTITYNYTGE